MLTQHLKYVKPSLQTVKFLTAVTMTYATALLLPHTAQASPGLETIVEKEYSVKFKRSLLDSETGLRQVYTAMQSKAKKACRIGKAVDRQGGELISKSECVFDLMDQFVESADLKTLTVYHLDQEKMGG
ncbi:MAG: UrcA family protein [Hellea sp.]